MAFTFKHYFVLAAKLSKHVKLSWRLPVGGCQSNLIQAQKNKRLLRFARSDKIEKGAFSVRHE